MKQQQSGGIADPAKVEVHPIGNLFPMIEGAEFDELVEDLRQNGLRTPLVLHPDGRLLDGRNRLRACLAAGVEPRFECWDGKGSALELVISLNLRRRHLNESQRAMLAARLKDKLPEESGKPLSAKGISSANLRSGKSAERAAALLNVSSRSVEHASQLLKLGDRRLLVLVESGQLAGSGPRDASRRRAGRFGGPLQARSCWRCGRRRAGWTRRRSWWSSGGSSGPPARIARAGIGADAARRVPAESAVVLTRWVGAGIREPIRPAVVRAELLRRRAAGIP